MADRIDQITELTALWLGADAAELTYIDDDLIALDDEAEEYAGTAEAQEIGGLALSSLYYNRPALGTVSGIQVVFFFKDCLSTPRWRIRRDRIFRTFAAGSCISFPRYKMFYQ